MNSRVTTLAVTGLVVTVLLIAWKRRRTGSTEAARADGAMAVEARQETDGAACETPPPAEAASSTVNADPKLATGTAVALVGLQSKPELNGQRGRIAGFDSAKGRYSVRLTDQSKTLQVKPANIEAIPASPESMLTVDEVGALSRRSHEAITTAHMERVIELLRASNEYQALDACKLLRCCCCFRWYLPVAMEGDGTTSLYNFRSPELGMGVAIGTEPRKIKSITDKHSDAIPTQFMGAEIFTNGSTANCQFLSLNPSDEPLTPGGEQRFTMLTRANHFELLDRLSKGIVLERAMAALTTPTGGNAAAPKRGKGKKGGAKAHASEAEQLAAEAEMQGARLLVETVFYCFNAAADAESPVLPVNVITHSGAHYMLLYSSPDLLELARPVLEGLGAFAGKASVPAEVPAKGVMESLSAPAATNGGVFINEFVPDLADAYKAVELPTERLKALFQLASPGVHV